MVKSGSKTLDDTVALLIFALIVMCIMHPIEAVKLGWKEWKNRG